MTLFIYEGTGVNCSTNNHAVIGQLSIASNQVIPIGTGASAIAATDTAAEDLCLTEASGSVLVTGVMVTVQQ